MVTKINPRKKRGVRVAQKPHDATAGRKRTEVELWLTWDKSGYELHQGDPIWNHTVHHWDMDTWVATLEDSIYTIPASLPGNPEGAKRMCTLIVYGDADGGD